MKLWLKQCAQDRILRFGSPAMFLKYLASNVVAWWSFSKTTPGDAAQAVVTTCRIPDLTRGARAGASMLKSVLDTVRLLVRQIQNILTFLFDGDNRYVLIDSR
ncbi:MAG: hypothetical protein DRP37_01690 [Thermodesulfobacteriota bacterium]|nr:MAG: hypothetical protein DRP37_01690 [Thermodesulfobacteriota bacterium]